MHPPDLAAIVFAKYPHLAKRFTTTFAQDSVTLSIPLHNPRYELWIMRETARAYIVGIDFLHAHFDSGDAAENLEDALEYLDGILRDEIVTVGRRDKKENFQLAMMDRAAALSKYANAPAHIEIVGFSREYP